MLKIGLTGGIGSGKSVISKIFCTLGVPVFYSDAVSKTLINHNRDIIDEISEIFGEEIYRDGVLDRKKLSELVFTEKELLDKLNSIIHPFVSVAFREWLKEHSKKSYIIKEAAIIFESGTENELDYVITVSAPESLRISRVVNRDGVSKEDVQQRMKNQMNDAERIKLADEVILNDEKKLIIPQVLELHKKFQDLAE